VQLSTAERIDPLVELKEKFAMLQKKYSTSIDERGALVDRINTLKRENSELQAANSKLLAEAQAKSKKK